MLLEIPEPLGRPRRGEYTPQDFLAFRESETLVISPKFQRRTVWKLPQRSYFIDTLIRGLPVPPLFLRETQAEDYSRMVREVIDGQQRLRTVLDFIDGKFAISRSLHAPWGGLRFKGLPEEAQSRIWSYHFACEVFEGISDSAVLDIFARMNTYSTPLNKQELRNGRFFGHFKQLSYQLAREYLQFWRNERLFTEGSIARMLEVELVSELLIMGCAGLQDKKTTIDTFYGEWDEEFELKVSAEEKFRITMDALTESVGDILPDSEFRRIPLFYSLYGAIYHHLFGLPGVDLPHTPRKKIRVSDRDALNESVQKLSALVGLGRDDEKTVPRKYQRFVTSCLSQTDNIGPRLRRLTTVYTESGLG